MTETMKLQKTMIMKKIFLFVALVTGTVIATSCSDDELVGSYTNESSIEILKSDVLFEARASQGSIEFNAPEAVTVTSQRDWCHASLSGNTVNVSVETNDGLQGRSSVVTLHCGKDSTNIVVQQRGVYFVFNAGNTSISAPTDEATTLSYPFTSNLDMEVTTENDWIKPSISDGVLTVSYLANNTGTVRRGSVKVKSGAFETDIKVSQFDFDKDIAQHISKMEYRTSSNLASSSNIATVDATITKSQLTLKNLGGTTYKVPMIFDENECAFTIPAGQYIGTNVYNNVTYYLYTCISNGSSRGWGATYQLDSDVVTVDGRTQVKFPKENSNNNLIAFTLTRFTEQGVLSSSTVSQNLHSFYYAKLY